MPKTRRKRINGKGAKNRNIELRVVEQGIHLQTKGHRIDGAQMTGVPKDAKRVFVGRQYTGINAGKVYPYASAKRGGVPRP